MLLMMNLEVELITLWNYIRIKLQDSKVFFFHLECSIDHGESSFIQANIGAPSTLLDFPTRDRFIEEIKTVDYDIVAISAILPNLF